MTWDWRAERNERHRFVDERMRNRKPVLATTLMFVVIWLSGWACSAVLLHSRSTCGKLRWVLRDVFRVRAYLVQSAFANHKS